MYILTSPINLKYFTTFNANLFKVIGNRANGTLLKAMIRFSYIHQMEKYLPIQLICQQDSMYAYKYNFNITLMFITFQIYVHGPYELPDSSSKSIHSDDGFFLQVYLTALTLFSSRRARELSVGQRNCRFHDESNLQHNPVYSYRLCRMECRIRISKKLCNCMPHFYRKLGKKNKQNRLT